MPGRKNAPTKRRVTRQDLWRSIKSANLKDVQEFITSTPELLDANNSHHERPLSLAIKLGNVEVVRFLIEAGAQTQWHVHGVPIDLLMIAAFFGHIEIGQYLITQNFAPNSLHAAGLDDVELLANLSQADAGCLQVFDPRIRDQPIHIASRAGSRNALEFLVTNGIDVDAANQRDQTPLFLVAECVHTERAFECARFLLASGADPRAYSSFSECTAAGYAKKRRKPKLVKLLS